MNAPTDRVAIRNAPELLELIRQRCDAPSWAVFENVANGTGSRADRWADALAMSLWPSRGLEFHGFEIKVSRSDLVRELRDPRKADAVGSYCDYWWIVAGSADLAKPDELPPAWGLLVPQRSGARKSSAPAHVLRVAKPATRLDAKAVDRSFVAAILRRAAEHFNPARIRQQLQGEVHSQVHDAIEKAFEDKTAYDMDRLRQEAAEWKRQAEEARASLMELSKHHFNVPQIQRAIELLLVLSGWRGAEGELDRMTKQLHHDMDRLRAVHEGLTGTLDLVRVLLGTKPNEST